MKKDNESNSSPYGAILSDTITQFNSRGDDIKGK